MIEQTSQDPKVTCIFFLQYSGRKWKTDGFQDSPYSNWEGKVSTLIDIIDRFIDIHLQTVRFRSAISNLQKNHWFPCVQMLNCFQHFLLSCFRECVKAVPVEERKENFVCQRFHGYQVPGPADLWQCDAMSSGGYVSRSEHFPSMSGWNHKNGTLLWILYFPWVPGTCSVLIISPRKQQWVFISLVSEFHWPRRLHSSQSNPQFSALRPRTHCKSERYIINIFNKRGPAKYICDIPLFRFTMDPGTQCF